MKGYHYDVTHLLPHLLAIPLREQRPEAEY